VISAVIDRAFERVQFRQELREVSGERGAVG
jgi:hypothetical protein